MKSGHCKQNCAKYDHIDERCKFNKADECYFLRVDMNRITSPRRKGRITITFEHEMEHLELMYFEHVTSGKFNDPRE